MYARQCRCSIVFCLLHLACGAVDNTNQLNINGHLREDAQHQTIIRRDVSFQTGKPVDDASKHFRAAISARGDAVFKDKRHMLATDDAYHRMWKPDHQALVGPTGLVHVGTSDPTTKTPSKLARSVQHSSMSMGTSYSKMSPAGAALHLFSLHKHELKGNQTQRTVLTSTPITITGGPTTDSSFATTGSPFAATGLPLAATQAPATTGSPFAATGLPLAATQAPGISPTIVINPYTNKSSNGNKNCECDEGVNYMTGTLTVIIVIAAFAACTFCLYGFYVRGSSRQSVSEIPSGLERARSWSQRRSRRESTSTRIPSSGSNPLTRRPS